MSYQVLARKWRPRSFAEMAGQEHVLQALINALDNDRLHHAYLFTGTQRCGQNHHWPHPLQMPQLRNRYWLGALRRVLQLHGDCRGAVY